MAGPTSFKSAGSSKSHASARPLRSIYIARLAVRCAVFALCAAAYLFRPESLSVVWEGGFFRRISPLHLLWAVWVIDMLQQLFPIGSHVPLGSHKLFARRFSAASPPQDTGGLREYTSFAAKGALKVFTLWALLTAALGYLCYSGMLGAAELFMISVFFYLCDLICVVIWCPFRLIMKTRCCTTCRIYNWDHLMMFAPMLFIGSFFARSLVIIAAAVWALWEWSVIKHPERFWEGTNQALLCSGCTDRLCSKRHRSRKITG